MILTGLKLHPIAKDLSVPVILAYEGIFQHLGADLTRLIESLELLIPLILGLFAEWVVLIVVGASRCAAPVGP